jgi:PAS domain S-box-containing protein
MKKVHILQLEDNEDDISLIHMMLKTMDYEFDIKTMFTKEDFESAVTEYKFDLILADYSLPNYNGLAALKYLQSKKIDLPFILISGAIGEEKTIEMFKAGVTDFILKAHLYRLIPSIIQTLEVVEEKNKRRVAEERLTKAFYDASICMALVTPIGKLLQVNQAFCKMLDYKDDELLTLNLQNIGFQQNFLKDKDFLSSIIKEHSMELSFEQEFLNKSGKILWGDVHISQTYDLNNETIFLLQIQNITLHKMIEADLRRYQIFLTEALHISNTGVWEWEMRTNTWRFSQEWCNLHGTQEEIMSTEQLLAIIHPDDRSIFKSLLTKISKSPQLPLDLTFRIIRSDTQQVRFIHQHGRIQDANNLLHKFLGVSLDITEQKNTETQLISYVNQLKESNEALDDFAYIASHDLRSPLRAINQLAQWIMEDCENILPDASKQHLIILRSRTERLDNMLKGLLLYSRVGRTADNISKIKLREFIEQIKDLLSVPDGFTILIKGRMPTFSCKIAALQTVMQNLIDNSIKHRTRDDQIVTITCKTKKNFYEISVSDNGAGIAKEYHKKIFEFFTTLKPRDEVEGSGIGLAVVKKIVLLQGGAIQVHNNKENTGVTFTFTWPKLPT